MTTFLLGKTFWGQKTMTISNEIHQKSESTHACICDCFSGLVVKAPALRKVDSRIDLYPRPTPTDLNIGILVTPCQEAGVAGSVLGLAAQCQYTETK